MDQIVNEPDNAALNEYDVLEQLTPEINLRTYALASIAWSG